ncbi:MAG TPA: CsiV family protein [Steroidobacteraceae bacterium]|jgi:hypothetical protein|nr:CsiV family protein [Steroidobacteraceae bacterium]
MKRIPIWLLCLAITLCLPAHAAAPAAAGAQGASPYYDVEIIVFRASSPGADEDWTAPVPGRGFGSTATRGGAAPAVVKVLGATDYHLNTLETALKNSGAWRPIAHAAWIQTAANWGTHTGFALSDLGINVPGLSGTVYVERGTYIHLGFEIQYESGAGPTYTINEMRSVKYNEKQYFDHPAVGIIALVSPIKRGSDATMPTAH